MTNTNDLSQFGYDELEKARKLLKEYSKNKTILEGDVRIEFNPSSGNVFLLDENFNVCMLNNDKIERFYWCPICGHEGFKKDMRHGEDNNECQDYLEDIGVLEEHERVTKRL